MHNKSFFIILAVVAIAWLGYMAWLSGYQQGFNQGSEHAWNDARSFFSHPIPPANIESFASKNP